MPSDTPSPESATLSAFERLHGAVQYQVVHGLGFTSLRPVQELSIAAILDGDNAVILAPTAGGKTESAFLPLLSLMVQDHWQPISVLYISPIRALLNNQEVRLERLARLVGRSAKLWHGDVTTRDKRNVMREPPDILLTTAESLEVMLMSSGVPAQRLFAGLRAVVIDEVHAFAGDDRGGHLLSVLERLSRLCGRDVQRIGLSATVGNPATIAAWLKGSSKRHSRLVDPPRPSVVPQISIDYVATVENAATVIERLHPGKKRLVFVDSRAGVERLGEVLQERGVRTFVLHSALAKQQRQDAETAFATQKDCVIVATSTLELGIDIGDLDHVLQLDAPSTVSSFMQRMGRTGRRSGTVPNCTFLCTDDASLLQATAIVRLHRAGWVEPVRPVTHATHLLAHQLMALSIQESGIPTSAWWAWISQSPAFAGIEPADRIELVAHMLEQDILAEVDGRYALAPHGESLYGAKNFLSLYSVFDSKPTFAVFWGRKTIGVVEASFVLQAVSEGFSFTLGARAWRINRVDWERGWLLVSPAAQGKAPRWQGTPRLLSQRLCQEVRGAILDAEPDPAWSARAAQRMLQVRDNRHEEAAAGRALIPGRGGFQWFTFAGGRANGLLAALLEETLGARITSNNERLLFVDEAGKSAAAIADAIDALRADARPTEADAIAVGARGDQRRLSKFQPCLPPRLEALYVAARLYDVGEARAATMTQVDD